MIRRPKKIKLKVENTDLPFRERIMRASDLTEEDLELDMSKWEDPFLFQGMMDAVFEISKAIQNKERIWVHGDYDIDGITATYILYSFLKKLTPNVFYHIPQRYHGYGLTDKSIEKMIKGKADLMITVDCGITGKDAVRTLKSNGIKIVVTDHHEVKKEELPDVALSVVDPHLPTCPSTYKEICGAAVSLKLVWGLCQEFELGDAWMEYIPYAAIGTIGDVMPLRGQNRMLVAKGLEMIRKTEDIGLRTLIRFAKEDFNGGNFEKLTAGDIGFYVGPMMNAPGRLFDPLEVLEMLLETNEEKAIKTAGKLQKINNQRKEVEKLMVEQGMHILHNYDFSKKTPIVLVGENWEKGVVGVAAGRISEKYMRPSIVLSYDREKGELSGSCRSYNDISIFEALSYAGEYLSRFGGHKKAAGLKLDVSNLKPFISKLNEYFDKNVPDEEMEEIVTATSKLKLSEINLDNLYEVSDLEPFGATNPTPTFLLENVQILSMDRIGKKEGAEGAHLKMIIKGADGETVEAIGFSLSDFENIIENSKKVSLLCSLSENNYNGEKKIQLFIKNILPTSDYEFGRKLNLNTVRKEWITRENVSDVFNRMKQLVKKESNFITSEDYLYFICCGDLSPDAFWTICQILHETGKIKISRFNGMVNVSYRLNTENITPASETETYKNVQEIGI